MFDFSSDIIKVIYELLPGFVAMWIFYALTSYTKPNSIFERIIQALIATALGKAILIVLKITVLKSCALEDHVLSIGIAILLGILFSWCVNHDFPLWLFRKNKLKGWTIIGLLQKLKLTKKTMHPSEWYSFFSSLSSNSNSVILHLNDGNRLYGKVNQYPDYPDNGFFILSDAYWLKEDGSAILITNLKQMLISAKDIVRVEWQNERIEIKKEGEAV